MHADTHVGELLSGKAIGRSLTLPLPPKTKSNGKRVAAGTLGRILRPLRAIKPIDWMVSRAFQVWYEMPVAPTHFYSPLPDIAALKGNLHRWYRDDNFAEIRIDLNRQKSLLKALGPFSAECEKLPSVECVTAEGYGLGFGEVEAHLLYSMIRHFQPHRIIEVGSGVSTYFALSALEVNRRKDGVDSDMVCIEPHLTSKLRNLAAQGKVQAYDRQVQDVECGVFEQLAGGDILFIDSSHVSKVDSDVNFLFFEVFPRLRNGVIVHLHDIPFPYMTCPPGHSMYEKSMLWNEAALLRAFLMWNGAFEILICQSYLHRKCPESIKKVIPIYDHDKHFPSSLWLRKAV